MRTERVRVVASAFGTVWGHLKLQPFATLEEAMSAVVCETRLPALVCPCGQVTFVFCWWDGAEEWWEHRHGIFARKIPNSVGFVHEHVPLERATVSGEALVRLLDGTPVSVPRHLLPGEPGPRTATEIYQHQWFGSASEGRPEEINGGGDTRPQVCPSGELPGDLETGFIQALVELAKHGEERGFRVVAERAGIKGEQVKECYEGTRARVTKGGAAEQPAKAPLGMP